MSINNEDIYDLLNTLIEQSRSINNEDLYDLLNTINKRLDEFEELFDSRLSDLEDSIRNEINKEK